MAECFGVVLDGDCRKPSPRSGNRQDRPGQPGTTFESLLSTFWLSALGATWDRVRDVVGDRPYGWPQSLSARARH
eukprot:11214191-Lingulodinium_polyedra.AAC.1